MVKKDKIKSIIIKEEITVKKINLIIKIKKGLKETPKAAYIIKLKIIKNKREIRQAYSKENENMNIRYNKNKIKRI